MRSKDMRLNPLNRLVALVSIIIVAVLAGGCASSEEATGGSTTMAATTAAPAAPAEAAPAPAEAVVEHATVVFALPVASPDEGQVWAYVPQAAGFFADENLTVEFVPSDGGTAALRQVAAGNADFSVNNPEALINAVAEGLDLRAVASVLTSQIHGLRTLEGSGVSSYEDLRGGRVAISSFTSGSYHFARFALAENGLDPDTDVEFVATGSRAGMLDAAESGDVDAFAVWDTRVALFSSQGAEIKTLPSSRKDMPADLLIANGEFIDASPDVVVRFARAVFKGIVFARANPEAAVEMFQETFPESADSSTSELSKALLNSRLANAGLVDGQKGWGDIPVEGYRALLEADLALGIVETLPENLEDVLVTSFGRQIRDFDMAEVEILARGWTP